MHLNSILLLATSCFSTVNAAKSVCDTGIFAIIGPQLSNYAPAKAFCASKYPAAVVTTTIYKRGIDDHADRRKRAATTTAKSNQAGKDVILSSMLAKAGTALSQMCSCMQTTKIVSISAIFHAASLTFARW